MVVMLRIIMIMGMMMMNTKKVGLIWMMTTQGPIKTVFAPDQ